MLRKIFSLLVGKERYEPQSDDKALDEQDSPYLNEIKSSLQSDFSFLYVNYGFQIIGERRVGPDGCFIVLQNEVMQLRVSSGGALGGYGWSVGDRRAINHVRGDWKQIGIAALRHLTFATRH